MSKFSLFLPFDVSIVLTGFENYEGLHTTMCTHRVKISAVDEIDKELKAWIKEAINLIYPIRDVKWLYAFGVQKFLREPEACKLAPIAAVIPFTK